MEYDRRQCPPGIEIVAPESADDLIRYFRLRWQLLREPWNQPPGSEKDELEKVSHHLMARTADGEIVSVGRLHFPDVATAQIRYMATKDSHRRRGIGAALATRLENIAVTLGARTIVANAREPAVPFYEKLGYRVCGDGQILFGTIRHKRVEKLLADP